MGIMTVFKARSAAAKLSKGDVEGAMRLYKEAIDEGLQDVRNILTYTVLLIRAGRYQEARDLLVKIQKYPMTDDNRREGPLLSPQLRHPRDGPVRAGQPLSRQKSLR